MPRHPACCRTTGRCMTLGASLKLGYLECTVTGKNSPNQSARNALVVDDTRAFGGTLKISETDSLKGSSEAGYVKDEAPMQPLEWTHPPVREVHRDGNMRYQVSKKAVPSQQDNRIHLVRTTRLEPRPSSRSSSRPSSRPPSRQPGPRPQADGLEEIVVTEA